MIKAIIFDFFGVLVTEGFKKFRDEHFPGDKANWKQAIELVNKHDSGLVSKQEFIQGLADISGRDFDYVARNINNNQPNDQLIGYIKTVLKPHYKIGVLSNSGDNYIAEMLQPSDVKIFDDVLLSYRFGMIKPQLEIFELAAKRLGVELNKCVFIDDSLSHCAGASRAGLTAILYKNFPQMKTELEKILAGAND